MQLPLKWTLLLNYGQSRCSNPFFLVPQEELPVIPGFPGQCVVPHT